MAWTSLLIIIFSSILLSSANAKGLRDNYYSRTCPQAESLIQRVVNAELDINFRLGAGLIRMQYHDCFVEGCDASILLDGNHTEKKAPVNEHLTGFEVIDAAKAAVEAECPGVVSCADIIAYAARDSVVKLNGTGWEVQGGRRDGTISCAEVAESELPPPTFAVSQLLQSFTRRGLSLREMVILSGSHTVGVSHCEAIIQRLYNFSRETPTDPSLNATYAKELRHLCPKTGFNESTIIFMDPISPAQIDSNYYVTLTQRKGLFTSDQSLLDDPRTRRTALSLVNERRFDARFGRAMRALGAVEVKTAGEIRSNCRQVNYKLPAS